MSSYDEIIDSEIKRNAKKFGDRDWKEEREWKR